MAASFLHGIETIETTIGGLPITIVRSAVLGIVGAAPRWMVGATNPVQPPLPNKPTLCSGLRDDSQFGPMVQGYNIPYALNILRNQNFGGGSTQAIVVDVFDPSVHNTAVSNQALSMPASGTQVVNTGHMGLIDPALPNSQISVSTVVVENGGGSPTYVEGTDYTVDAVNGLIYAKAGGAITQSELLLVSYSYCDPSKVTDADVVGTFASGVYTGIQAFLPCFTLFGFFPKLLVSQLSKDSVVAAALDAMANTIRAVAYVNSPPATAVGVALANRGVPGNAFNTSSKRTVLCFPTEQFTDLGIVPTGLTLSSTGQPVVTVANNTQVRGLAEYVVGVQAAVDVAFGYWFSASNNQIDGVIGPDVSMYMSAFDPAADCQTLNAAGILTVFNSFGTGIRVFGNRSAAYPTSTAPDQFIPIRRALDVLEESVQLFALQFLDKPISNGLINQVLASVNGLIRTLVQRGALISGSTASYSADNNPPTQLAAGQVVWTLDVMPPPPAERMTFNVTTDTSLLANLGPVSTGSLPQLNQ